MSCEHIKVNTVENANCLCYGTVYQYTKILTHGQPPFNIGHRGPQIGADIQANKTPNIHNQISSINILAMYGALLKMAEQRLVLLSGLSQAFLRVVFRVALAIELGVTMLQHL